MPLLATVLCYGLAQGFYKQVPLSAAQFCILLVLVKTLVNWGSWGVLGRRSPFEPGARRFISWALAGQLINGLGWVGYFVALDRGPAALVGTITAAYTAVTVVLALLFLRERLGPWQLLGVGLAVTASALLGYTDGPPAAANQAGWFALSVSTLVLWGVAVCIFKHAYNQEGADDYRFFLTNWLGVTLTMLPFGLATMRAQPWDPSTVLRGSGIVLLYALGDLTLFWAIGRGPASIVTPLTGLYPIPTIAYSVLVLKEKLGGLELLALMLVLLAIVLIVPGPGRKNPAA